MSIWDRTYGKYNQGLDIKDARRLAEDLDEQERRAEELARALDTKGPGIDNDMKNEFGHSIRMNLMYDSDDEDDGLAETQLGPGDPRGVRSGSTTSASKQARARSYTSKFQTLKMEPGHKEAVDTQKTCCCSDRCA